MQKVLPGVCYSCAEQRADKQPYGEIESLHKEVLLMSQFIPLIPFVSLILNLTIMNTSVLLCHGSAAHTCILQYFFVADLTVCIHGET